MSEAPRKAKICMLGSFAVGKTSLVGRFVHSIFSDTYQTTIGVKVDKKSIDLDDHRLDLMVWDLAGEDEFQAVRMSYLRGAAGYLLVIDGTRRATMEVAIELQQRAESQVGPLPFVVLINKADLVDEWQLTEADMESLTANKWEVKKTSAKTAAGVEEAFLALGRSIST